MSFKICLLVSVVLTLLYGVNSDGGVRPLDILEDAQLLFEDLDRIVHSATIAAQTQLSTTRRQISEVRGNLSTASTAQIEESSQKLVNQLDNLLVLADALGVPVCLYGRKEELNLIKDDLVDDLEICLLFIERESSAVVVNATIYITRSQLRVETFKTRLTACTAEEDNEECARYLIAEMELARDEIPTTVLEELLHILRLAEDWKDGLSMCSRNRVGLIYTEGNRIVFEVESCIVAE